MASSLRDLECSICLTLFNDPRNLPCGHSFDYNCLLKLSINTCPECRAPFEPDILPINYPLKRLVDGFQSSDLYLVAVKNTCASCQEEASVYCDSCKAYICSTCISHHDSNPFTKLHKVVNAREAQGMNCKVHDKTLEYYCEPCRQLTCTSCVVLQHSGHPLISIAAAAENQRLRLHRLCALLGKKIEVAQQNISTYQTKEKQLEQQIAELNSLLISVREAAFTSQTITKTLNLQIDSISRLSQEPSDIDLLDQAKFASLIKLIETQIPDIIAPAPLQIGNTYVSIDFSQSAASLSEFIHSSRPLLSVDFQETLKEHSNSPQSSTSAIKPKKKAPYQHQQTTPGKQAKQKQAKQQHEKQQHEKPQPGPGKNKQAAVKPQKQTEKKKPYSPVQKQKTALPINKK